MIRWGIEGRRLSAQIVAVGDACWFCHSPVRAIAGVLVDPGLTADRSGFVPIADVASVLVALLEPGALARHGIGDLRHRASPGVQGGYVANGCPGCDALIGRFRVEDLVREHLAAGGTIEQLAIGVTVDLLNPSLRTDVVPAPLRQDMRRPAA
jgi:hypothetical protein